MEHGTQEVTDSLEDKKFTKRWKQKYIKNSILLILFRVYVVVNVTIMTLRNVITCIVLGRYRVFGGTCGLIRPL
jgi:uncharacterized membrane protein